MSVFKCVLLINIAFFDGFSDITFTPDSFPIELHFASMKCLMIPIMASLRIVVQQLEDLIRYINKIPDI